MNIVISGPADCPRTATARVIAEMARCKYAAVDTEILALDPDQVAMIAETDGIDATGFLQMTHALLNAEGNRVFVMDGEGLGRFLGTFPSFPLARVGDLSLEALADYEGDSNEPEYFIEVFDALGPALIALYQPLRTTAEAIRTESNALWYFIFSTVFD